MLCAAYLFSVAALPAYAGEVVAYADTDGPVKLARYTEFLEDPQGALSADEIYARAGELQWTPVAADTTANFGLSSSAYWLRFAVRYGGTHPTERVLEAGIPQIDDARVFVFSGGKQRASIMLGDSRPFTSRPIKDRRLLAPLSFEPGETLDVFVRVKSSTSLQVPLVLWTRDALYENTSGYGVFYGVMLAMILYNLLVFASIGDRRYLYLTLFAATITLYHASLSGHAFRYLWPGSPGWNSAAPMVFGFAGVALFIAFTTSILELKKHRQKLHNVLAGAGLASVAFSVASLFLPGEVAVRLLLAVVLSTVPLIMAAGIITWRLGVERAGEFTVSWVVLLTGVTVLALSKIGLLPVNWITTHALEAGLVVQLVMLLYGAFTTSIRALRDGYHAEHEFATHDDLTGLPNRRLFKDRLDHALDKGRSRSRRVGLLFIDLDGFKSVNDTLGHVCGDMLLQGVARRLSTAVRRGDTVARIGGDEFTVILEDMKHNLDATLVARKISALFEQPVELDSGMRLTIRPSIGIACYPDDGNSPELLMNRADKAMYASKNGNEEPQVQARSVS